MLYYLVLFLDGPCGLKYMKVLRVILYLRKKFVHFVGLLS